MHLRFIDGIHLLIKLPMHGIVGAGGKSHPGIYPLLGSDEWQSRCNLLLSSDKLHFRHLPIIGHWNNGINLLNNAVNELYNAINSPNRPGKLKVNVFLYPNTRDRCLITLHVSLPLE